MLRFSQRLLLVVGIILLATYALVLVYRSVSSRLALRAFDQAQAAASTSEESSTIPLQGDERVDFSLWSGKRIREYKESLLIENTLTQWKSTNYPRSRYLPVRFLHK